MTETVDPKAAHYYDDGGWLADIVVAKAGVDAGANVAREKLRQYAAVTGGGPTVTEPAGANVAGMVPPAILFDDIVTPDRAPGVFASWLPIRPLPETGLKLYRPRLTSGTSAAVQEGEGDAISSTDWATDYDSMNVVTVSADVSFTLQLAERAMIDDREVMGEINGAIEEQIDDLLLNGVLADDGMTGAFNTAWDNASVDVTTANKPYDKLLALLAKANETVHAARKLPPDIAVMHPRRWGVFTGAVDANKQPGPWQRGWEPVATLGAVVSPQVPTNLGTGNNRDGIVVMRTRDARVYAGPTQVIPNIQSDGEKLTVRFDAYKYVAASFEGRKSSGVLLTGAGLTA